MMLFSHLRPCAHLLNYLGADLSRMSRQASVIRPGCCLKESHLAVSLVADLPIPRLQFKAKSDFEDQQVPFLRTGRDCYPRSSPLAFSCVPRPFAFSPLLQRHDKMSRRRSSTK